MDQDAAHRCFDCTFARIDANFNFSLRMDFSSKADVWQFPIETVSLSESGFERTYQGTVVALLKRLNLQAGSTETFDIKIEIPELKGQKDD